MKHNISTAGIDARPKRKTQTARVLDLLRNATAPVPAVELSKISLLYTVRVHELRRAGYRIINVQKRQPSGAIHSTYQLTGEPSALPVTAAAPIAEPVDDSPPLFPGLEPRPVERWRDPEEDRRGRR